MKQQGKDMGAVKGFLDGKTDQAAALTAATDLTADDPEDPGPVSARHRQAEP